MALQCVCIATEARAPRAAHIHCEDQTPSKQRRPGLKDIDLCAIQRRTEDENSKHNDHGCHLQGERRQNLINKLKMFLDDCDDRPVMKGRDKSGGVGKALGQSGFGPMIKYPGYVDYDHPYFSNPYNKMPALAMTVGQRKENPCPPDQMANWDACRGMTAVEKAVAEASGDHGGFTDYQDGKCHCAESSGEEPRCPAAKTPGAGAYQGQPRGCPPCGAGVPPPAQGYHHHREIVMGQGNAQRRYLCIPLPDDA